MIIIAPTALYSSILPMDHSTPGNVTWVISSNDPPRMTDNTQILPQIEEIKTLPPIIFNPSKRQVNTGAYVFNLSYSEKSKVGIGEKFYEAGQILEFNDAEDQPVVNLLSVPDVLDLQQDTNELNVSDMGLTPEEINRLNTESRKKMNTLISDLNDTLASIKSTTVSIQDNQRSLNETKKAAGAAASVFPETDEIVIKLNERIVLLDEERVILADNYNKLLLSANDKYAIIYSVREVVR